MHLIVAYRLSVPEELLACFDDYISGSDYQTRSEAIRALIREKLVRREWEIAAVSQEVIGTNITEARPKKIWIDRIANIPHLGVAGDIDA